MLTINYCYNTKRTRFAKTENQSFGALGVSIFEETLRYSLDLSVKPFSIVM